MTALDEPAEVGGGQRLNPREIVGHLLIVWPIEYVEHSPTQFSRPDRPSDVIVVDVVDLNDGVLARRAWWRQAQLIVALKAKIGKKLLVRMERGMATMGRNAPFQLVSMSRDPQCLSLMSAWEAAHPDFAPSVPLPAPPRPGAPDQVHAQAQVQGHGPALTPAPVPQETILERMARQASEGAARFASQQPDKPPY